MAVPHEQLVLDAGTMSLRTIVVRPGIVYGGRRGIVSDLLKDALNGLVRVIGPGKNRWPTVYDRDLGELYVRLLQSADAPGIYHANDEGDETVNDIVEAIANHLTQRPDVRHMPIPEARRSWGRTPTRWRSIRGSAARGRGRRDGRRRCAACRPTFRGCSKNSGTRGAERKGLGACAPR